MLKERVYERADDNTLYLLRVVVVTAKHKKMSKRQKRQVIDLPVYLSKLHSTWLIVIFYPKSNERALTLPCMF